MLFFRSVISKAGQRRSPWSQKRGDGQQYSMSAHANFTRWQDAVGTHNGTAHTWHGEQQGVQSADLAAGLMDSRRISHLSVKASTMAGSTSGYTCVRV